MENQQGVKLPPPTLRLRLKQENILLSLGGPSQIVGLKLPIHFFLGGSGGGGWVIKE